MAWIYLLVGVLLVVGLVRAFVERPGHGVRNYEFEHWIRSFLKIKKEGGTMTFSHSKSPRFVRFHRGAGIDQQCDLFVDVPRAGWSELNLDRMRERLEEKSISVYSPTGEPAVLLRARIEVPDIWDEASGASGARVAQELFEELGLDQQARYNVVMKGDNSSRTWKTPAMRWQDEANPLLRRIGRVLADEAAREGESDKSKPARK